MFQIVKHAEKYSDKFVAFRSSFQRFIIVHYAITFVSVPGRVNPNAVYELTLNKLHNKPLHIKDPLIEYYDVLNLIRFYETTIFA